MLDRLEDDPYSYRRKINRYYPFQDEGEWELGKFLVENLTQTQMIKFLKLKWFNTRERPSFTTKDQLLNWMDSLPCFTEQSIPVELIWRDALEVVKQLFGDPIFANHMTYICSSYYYMSADMAWKIQDYLPVGATQVPIILGSDKTHVTRITGGLEMHPVFITIGNIDSEVRSKATLRAWRCIAYMPIAKFRVHPDYQSILQARLWHKCMDLVLANLKAAALDGCFMPDPNRHIHFVFTPLVAHHTLQLIVDTSRKVDPWDLDKFQKAAKAVGLSGVHMPYWHDWLYASGEILHTCFKFFADHPLKWIKEVIGAHELDNRFIIQHKRVGMRHFAKGVSHVKQMTGREYREIQRTIVALIAGATSPQFVRSIRAIVDFIYLAQNPVHSPATLQSMEQALSEFHSFKGAIIEAEARKGKKGRLGTLMQFSADTTERLLITHCKNPFSRTAHQSKDFTEQCVRLLNRQESMEIFDLYALLTSRGVSLVNAMHAEEEEVAITNPALSWVSRILPNEVKSVRGPQPVCNHFLKGILSGDAQTAFQVNVTPDYRSLLPAEICTTYKLSNFNCALADFIAQSSSSSGEHVQWDPRYGCYQAWNKFRLQLHSAFQRCVIMPSRVVQAYPPSDTFPFGNCDAVLIDAMGINGKMIERAYTQDQNGNRLREGAVVRLTDVTLAVELIPCFSEKVASDVSSATCLEHYERFFLNNFADKESYHTFSTEFA
ncbi:hypothetical protein EDB19DRAFT_1894975 [Suillus lakei]|nr:hypothetical protein EDB19DRAFT_1894975 [Suillus lakei]